MDKIQVKYKNNPKGKGGFKDNPSNRNTKGRPPKGYSITEMMREMLANRPEVKEALGKVITEKALSGDITAIKTLWQYMDGMPVQAQRFVDGEGNDKTPIFQVSTKDSKEQLEKLYERSDSGND
jgi:hypothetical protein